MSPEYLYMCAVCDKKKVEVHSMFVQPIYLCCNKTMTRKPQVAATNWGGLKPSAGRQTQFMNDHIDRAPRRRDEIIQTKEEAGT